MPVKNAAPFLTECLDSIISQSYENWELLAVDDGSSDDSLQILKNYEQFDQRITAYRNDGVGIIDALRLAYNYSQGGMITRMDADDIMTLSLIHISEPTRPY